MLCVYSGSENKRINKFQRKKKKCENVNTKKKRQIFFQGAICAMNACGCGQTGKQENHSNNKPSTKKKQKYEIPNINKTNELMFVFVFF